MGETRLQLEARRASVETQRAIGRSLRDLRTDAGLSIAAVAREAGIDRSFLSRIERGDRAAGVAVLTGIATVLGADLSVKAYPNTGPRIRDRFQAPMEETLIRALDGRWIPDPEVVVVHPARGVIDLVLTDRVDPLLVASELQSEVRRLEQQIRWHREKELSLPSADLWRFATAGGPAATSRLLVLRSTRATRELANRYASTLRAAYPARTRDVIAALRTPDAPWPGAGVAWMRVEGGVANLLDGPPRGVILGR
jgi:transcriptional regulator with XRE-family HTH domain